MLTDLKRTLVGATVSLTVGVAVLAGSFETAHGVERSTGAAILQQLRSFANTGSVLYVAAHPDDENTQLIAYLEDMKVGPAPGVTSAVLHFATIITPDSDPVKRRGMLAVMHAKRASVATVPTESRTSRPRSEGPGWRVASHMTARTAQAAR